MESSMDLLFNRRPQKGFRLQKRAARVMLQVDTKSITVDNFKKLDWMPFMTK